MAFRDKQCSRPTCHPAIVLLRHYSGSLRASSYNCSSLLMESLGWLADMGPKCGSRFYRSRRSSGGWRTGVSTHHTIACSDVGGRVSDGACSSLAVEWPDPEREVAIRSQSDGCACVHETGWLWPLRMAKRVHEWATSGAETRNTAAYGHAISLGAFRTALGVGVDEDRNARKLGLDCEFFFWYGCYESVPNSKSYVVSRKMKRYSTS